jgi:hypothetical protein
LAAETTEAAFRLKDQRVSDSGRPASRKRPTLVPGAFGDLTGRSIGG